MSIRVKLTGIKVRHDDNFRTKLKEVRKFKRINPTAFMYSAEYEKSGDIGINTFTRYLSEIGIKHATLFSGEQKGKCVTCSAKDVGKNLKALREKSRYAGSDVTGVGSAMVTNIEKGKWNTAMIFYVKYMSFLGIKCIKININE